MAGCEVGLYPYVVPFSGARMAEDPTLAPHVMRRRQLIPGTNIEWMQPAHIEPLDPDVRTAIREIVASYDEALRSLTSNLEHVPSRIRSLLWISHAIPTLRAAGVHVPRADAILRKLDAQIARPRGHPEKHVA